MEGFLGSVTIDGDRRNPPEFVRKRERETTAKNPDIYNFQRRRGKEAMQPRSGRYSGVVSTV